jgi:transcriptional regulator with XRE-family HTH domain
MTIYDRIDECLKKTHHTRIDMCRTTDISYSTLSSLIQRKSKGMSLEMIKKIAGYLQVTVDYLISGENYRSSFIQENNDEIYNQENGELQQEILRVSKSLSTKNRTKLLAYAYELEADESKS